jgi:hypothetical protein
MEVQDRALLGQEPVAGMGERTPVSAIHASETPFFCGLGGKLPAGGANLPSPVRRPAWAESPQRQERTARREA